jgi:hypothetical protein
LTIVSSAEYGRADRIERTPVDFRYALAVSPYSERMLDEGFVFTDGERRAATVHELQEMYVEHGATELGAVVGTERHPAASEHSDSSLDAALARAQLARDLGVPFNPLLFLCRTYSDYSGQPSPVFDDYPGISLDVPWETLGIDEMASHLRRYTTIVAEAILSTGCTVSVWDLGQEVDLGVAGVTPPPVPYAHFDTFEGGGWYRAPDAVDPELGRTPAAELFQRPLEEYVSWLGEHVWPHTATLLAAAADGIRSVDPRARFSTHIVGSRFATAFWDALRDGGYEPDQLGFSWYPSAAPDATRLFGEFKDHVRTLVDRFGKPVVLTEYAYPAAPMSGGIFSDWSHEVDGYPLTEDGQAKILEDILSWGFTEGCLAGVRPFAPDLVVVGWKEMAFFRTEGKVGIARPVIDSFEHAEFRVRTAEV